MISLREVSKTHGDSSRPAVDSLKLEILAGEIMVLVGPSGCGKTTVLKMINRLVESTSGRVEVDGTPVGEGEPHLLRRSIGYVIQQVGFFPHWTVRRNIGAVPELLGWTPERITGADAGPGPVGGSGRVAARPVPGRSLRGSSRATGS